MSKYSPYYLLYSQHPHLPSNKNPFRLLQVVATTTAKHEKKISNLRNARSITNKALLKRAIKATKICKRRVENADYQRISIKQ